MIYLLDVSALLSLLASLAEKHGMQFATLEENIGHRAVFLIPR